MHGEPSTVPGTTEHSIHLNHPLNHSFIQHLLSTDYVSETVLGRGTERGNVQGEQGRAIRRSKTDMFSALQQRVVYHGEQILHN